jgi:hypothetical protein
MASTPAPAKFANDIADIVQRNTTRFVVFSQRHQIAQDVWDYVWNESLARPADAAVPPKITLDPGYIDNGGRGIHRIIDLMEHKCEPLEGAPERGAWKWRCPICGQRFVGTSGFGGTKMAHRSGTTSWSWRLSERRRRREVARANPQGDSQ